MAVQRVPQTAKKQIDTFLQVFGGGDGGVAFAMFKGQYEDIERRALEGDQSAQVIMAKVQGIVNLLQCFGNFDNEQI